MFLSIAIATGFLGVVSALGMPSEIAKVCFFLFLTLFVSLLAVGIERRFFSQRDGGHHRHIGSPDYL